MREDNFEYLTLIKEYAREVQFKRKVTTSTIAIAKFNSLVSQVPLSSVMMSSKREELVGHDANMQIHLLEMIVYIRTHDELLKRIIQSDILGDCAKSTYLWRTKFSIFSSTSITTGELIRAYFKLHNLI